MAYFIFLLVNAALFIRPAEIFPDWQGIEIYYYLIVLCSLVALPEVMHFATSRPIETQPLTLTVAGLFCCVVIAPLVGMDIAESWRTGIVFIKILIYFVLLVSLVSTPQRLQQFLASLVIYCTVLTTISVLKFFEIIEFSNLEAALRDGQVNEFGEVDFFNRLQGSGIFQDPNDLCMMLAAAVPMSLFLLTRSKNSIAKAVWLVSLILFAYAIYLTRSRGGLIALVSSLAVCTWSRYGLQRTLLIGSIGLPALLLVYGGRQTDISNAYTGQTRIQLWSEWMQNARDNLPFGKGMSIDKEEDASKPKGVYHRPHLAHNAYLQAFADLGLPGGCFFIGSYGLALWTLYRYRGVAMMDPDMSRLQPFLLASVTAYSVGMLTLSICYIMPTYLMLGLAVAYERSARTWPPLPPLRMDTGLLFRYLVGGIGYLIVMYIFVRLFINWG